MIGGHGQVGLRLLRLLAHDGHRGRGVIRKAEQAGDLQAVGAEAVLCDLERGDDLRPHLGGAEAIVFAAGAGPGSGPERKRTVDYGAAVASMHAARDLGVARFVIVSSIGTHDVALVLLECLLAPNTIGVEFELFEGDVPAREAIRSL